MDELAPPPAGVTFVDDKLPPPPPGVTFVDDSPKLPPPPAGVTFVDDSKPDAAKAPVSQDPVVPQAPVPPLPSFAKGFPQDAGKAELKDSMHRLGQDQPPAPAPDTSASLYQPFVEPTKDNGLVMQRKPDGSVSRDPLDYPGIYQNLKDEKEGMPSVIGGTASGHSFKPPTDAQIEDVVSSINAPGKHDQAFIQRRAEKVKRFDAYFGAGAATYYAKHYKPGQKEQRPYLNISTDYGEKVSKALDGGFAGDVAGGVAGGAEAVWNNLFAPALRGGMQALPSFTYGVVSFVNNVFVKNAEQAMIKAGVISDDAPRDVMTGEKFGTPDPDLASSYVDKNLEFLQGYMQFTGEGRDPSKVAELTHMASNLTLQIMTVGGALGGENALQNRVYTTGSKFDQALRTTNSALVGPESKVAATLAVSNTGEEVEATNAERKQKAMATGEPYKPLSNQEVGLMLLSAYEANLVPGWMHDANLPLRMAGGAASGLVANVIANAGSGRKLDEGDENALVMGVILGGVFHKYDTNGNPYARERMGKLMDAADAGNESARQTVRLTNNLVGSDAVSGAAITAAETGVHASEKIRSTPVEQLKKTSSKFRQILQSAQGILPKGEAESYAKDTLAREASENVSRTMFSDMMNKDRDEKLTAFVTKMHAQVMASEGGPEKVAQINRWANENQPSRIEYAAALKEASEGNVPEPIRESVAKDFNDDGTLTQDAFDRDGKRLTQAGHDPKVLVYPPEAAETLKKLKIVPYKMGVTDNLAIMSDADTIADVREQVKKANPKLETIQPEKPETNPPETEKTDVQPKQTTEQGVVQTEEGQPVEGAVGGNQTTERPVAEDRGLHQGRPGGEADVTARAQPVVDQLAQAKVDADVNPQGRVTMTPETDASALDVAANDTYTEPTQAQIEHGNYRKGNLLFKSDKGDVRVRVETPDGAIRKGEWGSRPIKGAHYGYLPGTLSHDGEPVDVLLTRNAHDDTRPISIIRQHGPDGKFDEIKVVMGAKDKDEALQTYLKQYPPGMQKELIPNGKKDIYTMPREKALKYIYSGNTDVPPHPVSGQPMLKLRNTVDYTPVFDPGEPRDTITRKLYAFNKKHGTGVKLNTEGTGLENSTLSEAQANELDRKLKTLPNYKTGNPDGQEQKGPYQEYDAQSKNYGHANRVRNARRVRARGRGKQTPAQSPRPKGFREVESDAPVYHHGVSRHPVEVVGVHYSDVDGLTSLNPRMAGTGSAGRERYHYSNLGSGDPMESHVYFYAKTGKHLPNKEDVVSGVHSYETRLNNVYDTLHDPDGIVARADAEGWGMNPDRIYEAIHDAGYDGALIRQAPGLPGPAVSMFGDAKIPVKQHTTEEFNRWAPRAKPTARFKLEGAKSPSEEPFYSQALRTVEEAKGAPKNADANAWKQWLDGAQKRGDLKKSERDWLGVDQFLDNADGKVSRQQLEDYVRANAVKLETVTKGKTKIKDAPKELQEYAKRNFPDIAEYPDSNVLWKNVFDKVIESRMQGYKGSDRASDKVAEQAEAMLDREPKFDSWITKGDKENYQETLITIPDLQGNFVNKHHFKEANILVHARSDDRVTSDGKNIFYIEELQSDWHQEGRDKGYLNSGLPKLVKNKEQGVWEVVSENGDVLALSYDRARAEDALVYLKSSGVPNAPMKRTQEWSMLGFKAMVRKAVEGGHDLIGWTTGKEQAERYELAKYIDHVRYDFKTGSLVGFDKNQEQVFSKYAEPDKLSDYVGKEAAQKIRDEHEANPNDSTVRLTNADLTVGGEGMHAFYDKMLPNEVKKWAKHFGAEVGTDKLVGKFPSGNYEYTGPTYTSHQIAEAVAASTQQGGHVYTNPLTGKQLELVFNRSANTDALRNIGIKMSQGMSFEKAVETRFPRMNDAMVKDLFGGKVEDIPLAKETVVHTLNITPEMREAAMGGLPMFKLRPRGPGDDVTHLSWEAAPSVNVPEHAAYEKLSHAMQAQYTKDIHDAVIPAVLDAFGLDSKGSFIGNGGWEGKVNPSGQEQIKVKKLRQQLPLYHNAARALGYLLKQDGVGYHHPRYSASMKKANAVHIEVGRPLTREETTDLYAKLSQMAQEGNSLTPEKADSIAPIPTPTGVRFLNFTGMDNGSFRGLIKRAAQTLPMKTVETHAFEALGDMPENNWKVDQNGEGYRQGLAEDGFGDTLGRLEDQLRPVIERIQKQYGIIEDDHQTPTGRFAQEPEEGKLEKVSAPKSSAPIADPDKHHAMIREVSDRITRPTKSKLTTEILDGINDAPKDVADFLSDVLPGVMPPAFTHGGKIYVMSHEVLTREDAEAAIFHELEHLGLHGTFADHELNPILDDIHEDIVDTPLFKQLEKTYAKVFDGAVALRRGVTEEYLANIAESGHDTTTWQKFVGWFRQQLRNRGLVKHWSDNDIRQFVRRAHENAINGRASRAGLDVPITHHQDDNGSARADYEGAAGHGFVDHYYDGTRRLTTGNLKADLSTSFDGLRQWVHVEDMTFDKPNELNALPRFAGEEGRAGVVIPAKLVSEADLDAAGLSYDKGPGVYRVLADREAAPARFSLRNYRRGGDEVEAIAERVLELPTHALSPWDRYQHFARRTRDMVHGQTGLYLKQMYIDKLASIEDAERKLFGGALLDASQSGYKMAELAMNSEAIAAATLKMGVPQFVDGSFVPKEGHKGLVDIFSKLYDTPDGKHLDHLWELYAIAKRADRLIDEVNPDGTPREKNLTRPEIDKLLALGDKYPVLKEAADEYEKFNNQLLDLAVNRGAMSPEMAEAWKENFYVPFYRVLEDETENNQWRHRGLSGQSVVSKKLTGSREKIQPVLENIVKNTGSVLDAIYRNEAQRRVIGLGRLNGMAERIPTPRIPVDIHVGELEKRLKAIGLTIDSGNGMTEEQRKAAVTFFRSTQPKGKDIVSVMENGHPEYYHITDPLFYQSIKDLHALGVFDKVFNAVFGAPKRLLTYGVTSTPGFMYRNFIRDTMAAAIQSGHNPNVIRHAWSNAKDVWTDSDYLNALRMAGYDGQGYFKSHALRHELADMRHASLINTPKKMWEAYRRIGHMSEQMNRLAIARKVIEQGGSVTEAAWQAQNLLNFKRHGAAVHMQLLIRMVPFLNARIQGLNRLVQGALGKDVAGNNRAKAITHFVLKSLALSAASMANTVNNEGDPRYERIPEAMKDSYWHFFVGNHHYILPKPFELGTVFGTVPDRAYRRLRGDDSQKVFNQSMARAWNSIFQFNPVLDVQATKPLIEDWANKDQFTGNPIVSESLAGLPDKLQYRPTTSPTAVKIAQAMPDAAPGILKSPVRLEHVLRGYTGTLGQWLLNAGDAVTRGVGAAPDRPESRYGSYFKQAMVGLFDKGNPETDPRNAYLQAFYDAQTTADKAAAGLRKEVELGHYQDAERDAKKHQTILQIRKSLHHTAKTLRSMRKDEYHILADPDMTPKQKRKAIDEITEARNKILDQIAPYLKMANDL